MQLFKSSRHGQELIIFAGFVLLLASFLVFKKYQSRLYEPGHLACMADCSEIKGNFRRYNHNILSGDQCICKIGEQIQNVWN
ncbi:MAG: hypothetical protein O2840_05135 [bacterium]|nr:hypothetical protein [bacterium]